MANIGGGSGSGFPSAIDTQSPSESSTTIARADVPNDLASAVIAIETELGTDPAGSLTNVKTFLQTEHDLDGSHGAITPTKITSGGDFIFSIGTSVASAAALSLGNGTVFDITGTVGITSIATKGVGGYIILRFAAIVTLTNDGDNLQLLSNITTEAGSVLALYEYEVGKWRLVSNNVGVDLSSPNPIGDVTPNTIKATSLELVSGAVVTDIVTTLGSSATQIATASAINTAIEALSITQGKLSTATSTFTQTASQSLNNTLAGGEFGFWTNISQTLGTTNPEFQIYVASGGVVSSQTDNIYALTGTGHTLVALQRYVTASKPYDLGDGLIHSFMHVLVKKGSGKIACVWMAPDPVWANHGPTNIAPEFTVKGKKYRIKKTIDKSKDISDPSRIISVQQEITAEFKNSDMALFPHPWTKNDLSTFQVLLLDPSSEIVYKLANLWEAGEDVADIIISKKIKFDNEHTPGRKTPHSSVMISKLTWKNTQG